MPVTSTVGQASPGRAAGVPSNAAPHRPDPTPVLFDPRARSRARTRLTRAWPGPLPLAFFLTCQRLGARLTRVVLWVRIASQRLHVFERSPARNGEQRFPVYVPRRPLRCSTSRFGIGQQAGSNATPLGLHRVAEKLGGGWPVGTVFRSRQPVGFTWQGLPSATITSRILWLEGLEAGLNRGGSVDSHARYIYIHGTGDELSLGHPASCGCIHLAADALLPLFDRLPSGTLVWITAA